MSRILPRSTPEAEGVDPAAVRRLVDRLDRLGVVHSAMVLRHGRVIAEGWWHPHTADRPHKMFSVSKSFTSTAVGMAVHEGLLTLDDKVLDLLPDDAPANPSENLRAMRVRDLLTMTAGHSASTMEGIDHAISLPGSGWARVILAQPVDHEPGTRFVYNTGATHLLSAILHRLTGERLLDYLTPRLLAPLGITHAEWVAAATVKQVENGPDDSPDWEQGYGYQFWQCQHGAYRADGAFGQYVLVWPEKDMVIITTSGLSDLPSVPDAVWDTFLPDDAWVTPAAAEAPALEGADTSAPLDLALRTPAGAESSPVEESLLGVTYDLSPNPRGFSALRLGRDADGRTEVTCTVGGLDCVVSFGHEEWSPGTCSFLGAPADVATAAAWTDELTLHGRIVFLGTPFELHLELRFIGDDVAVQIEQNVAFGERGLLDVVGKPRQS